MRSFRKATALSLIIVVFYISIVAENHVRLINPILKIPGGERTLSYSSFEKPNLFLLNRQEDRLETSFKDHPIFNLKKHAKDFNCKSLYNEVRTLCINSEYFSNSTIIPRNLTNCDIVFPFHYFW